MIRGPRIPPSKGCLHPIVLCDVNGLITCYLCGARNASGEKVKRPRQDSNLRSTD